MVHPKTEDRSLVGGNLLFVLDTTEAENARAVTASALLQLVKFFRSKGMEVESVLTDTWTCDDPCQRP